MAKKKTPAQDLELEQQPLFLKTLEYLPTDPEQLEQLAGQMLELFNDAMRAGSLRDIETSTLRYEAVVYRLNGDTFFGSGADDGPGTRLQKRFAAPAGTVPGWGQTGEYLLEVAGMLLRVKVDPWRGFNGVHSLSFYAVDAAAPFISETGFKSHFMHADKHVGQELGQAVRAAVEQLLQGDYKPRPINEKDRAKVSIPAWLAPALQGVTRNGQLTMPLHADCPGLAAAEKPAPMSNAERQRRHRQRLKELADTEGLKSIPLTQADRMVLSLGLLAHEDLFHRPEDWATTKKPGFDSLLVKLWPEGDQGRYLAEPERSTRRPAGFLREEIEQQAVVISRLQRELAKLSLGPAAPAEVVIDAADPKQWTRTVQLNRDQDALLHHAFSVFFTARADLKYLESEYVLENLERIFQGSPLWSDRVKAELDQDLGILNINKRHDKEAKRGWNAYKDERAQNVKLFKERAEDRAEIKRLQEALQQIAQEVSSGAAKVPAKGHQGYSPASAEKLDAELERLMDAVEELELGRKHMGAEIYALKKENNLLEGERNKAHAAIRTWEDRLRAANLSTDYRRQPGE